jgi:hypothetical protein
VPGSIELLAMNPDQSIAASKKAKKLGIESLQITQRQGDIEVNREVFLGAEIIYGNKSVSLPFLEANSFYEYELVSSILSLIRNDKPQIGIAQGLGIPGINSFQTIKRLLEKDYFDVSYQQLDPELQINEDLQALFIIAPKDTIDRKMMARLDAYLRSGGRIFVAASGIQTDESFSRIEPSAIGLNQWMLNKGVQWHKAVLIDANCGEATVRKNYGDEIRQERVRFPYYPILINFKEHYLSSGIQDLFQPYSSALFVETRNAYSYDTIALSSPKSNLLSIPGAIAINKNWSEKDFMGPAKPQVLGIRSNSEFNAFKMVLCSGENFYTSENNSYKIPDGNRKLILNAARWLTEASDLEELRDKSLKSRPLKSISDGHKMRIRYLNLLLPLALLLLIGILRFLAYRSARKKWKNL